MSGQENGNASDGDLAKAFQDVAKGEQAAAALESHLNSLESKLDELLAKAEEDQRHIQAQRGQGGVGMAESTTGSGVNQAS